MTTPPGWKVERLSAALGARVTGLDLAGQLAADEAEALADLLDEHLVLVLPLQRLSAGRLVELGQLFGDPLVHPFLDAIPGHPEILAVVKEAEEDETFGGELWHADITFMDPPASASLLHAIDVPEVGGDTLFANQYRAYEALPDDARSTIDGLEAVHVYPGRREGEPGTTAVHPVVRTHPRTGRSALFVNPAFVTRFVGMSAVESRPLLDRLHAHQTRYEFRGRVSWESTQLTIWDNRAVLHNAVNDYPGRRRELRRVTAMERDGL